MHKVTIARKSLYLGSALLILIAGSITPARADMCAQLRFRCEHKHELGDEGQGNCRRYKEMCSERRVNCRELRFRCQHKDELGEQGRGNCRRFYEYCT